MNSTNDNARSRHVAFAALFPELSATEPAAAEANFDEYLGLVVRVYNRISTDPQALARLRADLAARRGANAPNSRIL